MLFVNFKAYNRYETDSLYQWDINQKLNIVGLNLSEAPEVHFANANMERAIVRQAIINEDTITVPIPNSLLQEPLSIKAYIGVYEGETFKVIESIKIPIIPKERPTDYVFVDDGGDIYSYNEILNKMISFENKYGDINFDALNEYNSWVNDVSELKTRVTPIELGGTGAITANEARTNLGAARIVTGSYVGNGNYGEENPNTLSFDFTPKYIQIIKGYDNVTAIYPQSDARNLAKDGYGILFTWSENGVSWYTNLNSDSGTVASNAAERQLNKDGQTYYYIAIG